MNDFWIILTASIVAINTAILGSFLVLRKMAMVGDAISHAVLPGIVIAYFLSGSKVSVFLLIGATLTGVFATVLINLFAKRARIQNDAAIGITYTLLFAIGIILIESYSGGMVDIDLDCVLYGDIAMINLDKILIDGNLYIGPRAFYIELMAFGIILVVIVTGFKGFKILAFNQDYAKSLGIKTSVWHYALMTLVSLTTVLSFEVVGAVLVVGFLVIPPATALLITKDLKKMIMTASCVGIVAVVVGYYLSLVFESSITGMMILSSGTIFFATLLIKNSVDRIKQSKLLDAGEI